MSKRKHLRAVFAAVLLGLFAFTAPVLAQATGDELLKSVPAQSLFCVRVNNFDYSLGMMDQFLAGASPMPMAMMARMQLASLLGDPALANVNTAGNFAIFGFLPPGGTTEPNAENIFFGFLIPITDFKQFVAGNPNCSEPDGKGVCKITSGGGMTGQTKTVLIKSLGKYSLLGWEKDYDKLVAAATIVSADKNGLGGALDTDEREQAAKEPLWAFGNVQLASKVFGPVIKSGLEEAKQSMKTMQATAPGGDMSAIMDMYGDILDTLMKETKSLSIAVKPQPAVLYITETITAMPGTDMGNMFTAAPEAKQENNLLGYLKDGAVMNFAANMCSPCWKKLNEKGVDLFAAFSGESMTAEQTAEMKAMVTDFFDSLAGPVVCSFSIDTAAKSPFVADYVIAVKDVDKYNKALDKCVEVFNKDNSITSFYQKMGVKTSFEIKRGVGSYKGASIDSAKFAMESMDPNSPEGQMINAMYGQGFDYRWALVDKFSVCAISGEPDAAVRRLIDQVKAGGSKPICSEIKAALQLLPGAEKADFLVTYNYLRLFKVFTAFMPVPMPQVDIPTKSNINIAGKVGNGKLMVDVALPKEHLTEITSMFMMMQQQMMQQQMQQQNPAPQTE